MVSRELDEPSALRWTAFIAYGISGVPSGRLRWFFGRCSAGVSVGCFRGCRETCDFVVVAVLVDLFGNLEFAVCEVAGVFQAGEGLFEVVGLGQAVGNLVEDGV